MYDYRQAIDRVMRQEVETGQVAGAGYLLIQGGRERYFSACGYADREKKTPVKRDTIFRSLRDCHKSITCERRHFCIRGIRIRAGY